MSSAWLGLKVSCWNIFRSKWIMVKVKITTAFYRDGNLSTNDDQLCLLSSVNLSGWWEKIFQMFWGQPREIFNGSCRWKWPQQKLPEFNISGNILWGSKGMTSLQCICKQHKLLSWFLEEDDQKFKNINCSKIPTIF